MKSWKFSGVQLEQITKTFTEQGLPAFLGTVLVYNIGKNQLTILNDQPVQEIRTESYVLYLKNARSIVKPGEFQPIDKKKHLSFFLQLEREQENPAADIYRQSAKLYSYLMSINAEKRQRLSEFSQLVSGALEIIHSGYAGLESIEDLANKLAVSKHHLIREFSAQVSETPGKYLEKIRLERATLLLVATDYNLEIIANMVGFSSGNYFGKVFKRAYALTPVDYRTGERRGPLTTEEKKLTEDLESIYLV